VDKAKQRGLRARARSISMAYTESGLRDAGSRLGADFGFFNKVALSARAALKWSSF